MLPSSYTRRLRTKDLIHRNFPDISRTITSKSSSKTFTRVGFDGRKSTHAYLPYLIREQTKAHIGSRVSGQINIVLERLSEIDKKEKDEHALYKKKANALFSKEKGDTPIPPLKLEHSRLSQSKIVGRLKPIKEKNEKCPAIAKDTRDNLTKDRMVVLARTLMKDKRMATCYKRNPNRIEVISPIVCDGIPAWGHEFKSDIMILVPIKSLRYLKWKYYIREIGYIEIELPKKHQRAHMDIYNPLRADDNVHLSSSKLNKALVEVFMEGLKLAKFGEYSLVPELNFDYLNDTLELVYTKYLRIPLIPAIYLSADDPLYVIKPNLLDLDPASDTLFRACYLVQEENILRKISSTDHGLRVEAMKVIHTLCKQDWRLQALTTYQLKNVLMHDIDFEIDHSPRWQRLTRDICVQSILKRLLYFVKKQTLPHFFQSDLNLFKKIPEKTLRFMHTPLQRLVSNEPQLLRDLQRASRASRNYDDSDTSSDSDEDWW